MIRTTDNKPISVKDYGEVASFFCSSDVTSKKFEQFLKCKEEYAKLSNEYVLLHKKQCIEKNEKPTKYFNKLVKQEEDYAVEHYKKARHLLKYDEFMAMREALKPKQDFSESRLVGKGKYLAELKRVSQDHFADFNLSKDLHSITM